MNEKELLQEIAVAEQEYQDAKKALAEAKRKWVDAETEVIHAKLKKERLVEELRINRNTVPPETPVMEQRELDIERFRQDHPELVEWARQRDGIKGDE